MAAGFLGQLQEQNAKPDGAPGRLVECSAEDCSQLLSQGVQTFPWDYIAGCCHYNALGVLIAYLDGQIGELKSPSDLTDCPGDVGWQMSLQQNI